VTLVDSHCHLDDPRFDGDRELVIERAANAGVEIILTVGTGEGPPDLEAGLRVASTHERIFATVGVHPHDASKAAGDTWDRLRQLVAHPKVLAIGEIGLDYYYDNSPRVQQQAAFEEQLRISKETGKPVIIHTRDAWEDTMRILRGNWTASGIMHCFSGGPSEAKQALDMGFYLGFGGVITFPKADKVREAAKFTPLDRILVETDAPYLAPVPHRGKRNEPVFVLDTARRLAELKEIPIEELAEASTGNFRRLCLPEAIGSE
jgi:TatD DNase family protein